MVPSGCRVILLGTPSGSASMSCRNSSMAAKTSGSRTSPMMRRFAGSPSSAKRLLIWSTPMAKSDRSSRKSSTAKSPSSWAIPYAAGMVSNRATAVMRSAVFRCPERCVTLRSQSGFTSDLISFSSDFLARLANHSSTLTRMRGDHIPVNKKAAKIPKAASIPKERRAAMSLKRLAAKAAIVVMDVRVIALPTLESVILPAWSEDLPAARSSL